jgi:molecular chaperone GrpE (heat shock protein)
MNEPSVPRLSKLPFVFGDILLIATAAYAALHGSFLGPWQFVAVVAPVAFGAWLLAWPFVLEFRAAAKLAESTALDGVTAKIQDLDKVSANISHAILEWQHVQQTAGQTVTAAEHIAERMTTEARNFGEVMTRMNESEKSHLRLEVEKLRRAEGDWLGVTVRMLDHVYALHKAATRSGQRNVIEQLTHFQNACRETARRLGVVPVVPETGVPFHPDAHQLLDGATAGDGVVIADIIAPGFTFQGAVIRLPVVTVNGAKTEEPKAAEAQLSFDESPS